MIFRGDMNVKTLRWILGLVLVSSFAVVTVAQDSEDDAPPAREAAEREAAEREAAEDVFIPTEEIPADQEVTFPVDI